MGAVELPKYKCHKEVWALKIVEVLPDGSLSFEAPFADLLMDKEWIDKHNPKAGGYMVMYKGGYRSFSPAIEFEEGYTRI